MAALGEAAVEQRPVLVDLSAIAGDFERFLDNSAEFAEVARPSIRALGDAAPVGREAVRAARPNVLELRDFATQTPDLGPNLRITLEDFADPANAVERDPRSPGGRGYSGLEAVLRYVFSQSLTLNGFDQFGHMVRAAVHVDECAAYMDGERAKAEPDVTERCNAWLGPNQPGINQPDPSPPVPDREAASARIAHKAAASAQRTRRDEPDPGPSSTTCSRHDPPPVHIDRRQPGPDRGRHRARHVRRRLPRLQREPGPAVRAQPRGEGAGGQRVRRRARLRGARGRDPDRLRARGAHAHARERPGGGGDPRRARGRTTTRSRSTACSRSGRARRSA